MATRMISKAQITKIQTMLSRLGFSAEDRHELISALTHNRTPSTKDLTSKEATYLINYLNGRISPKSVQEQQEYQEQCKDEVAAIYLSLIHILLMPDRRTFSMCRSASLSRRTSSLLTYCANWVCRLRVL